MRLALCIHLPYAKDTSAEVRNHNLSTYHLNSSKALTLTLSPSHPCGQNWRLDVGTWKRACCGWISCEMVTDAGLGACEAEGGGGSGDGGGGM